MKSEQNSIRNVVYQDIIDKDEILEGLELAPKFENDKDYASKFPSTDLDRVVVNSGVQQNAEPYFQPLCPAVTASQLITGHRENVEPDGNCFFRYSMRHLFFI